MFHPFQLIPPRNRTVLFVLFFSLTMIVMLVLLLMGESLTTAAAPQGMITYELAGTVEKSQAILDSWTASQKVVTGFHLGLDFLFLFAFSSTIALAIIIVSEKHVMARRFLTVVTLLAWLQWFAALLDAIENVALLNMLLDEAKAPWPQIATGSAIVKFTLVFAGIGFVIFAGLSRLYVTLRSE